MADVNAVEVLLVENDPFDAELTLRVFKKNKLSNQVFHVKDGAEALDFVFSTGAYHQRSTRHAPKVVVLDLKLPKVDGIEVIRQIRANLKTRNTPIVIMITSESEKTMVESNHLGVNSYIMKPVEFEPFVKALSELGFYWQLMSQAPK